MRRERLHRVFGVIGLAGASLACGDGTLGQSPQRTGVPRFDAPDPPASGANPGATQGDGSASGDGAADDGAADDGAADDAQDGDLVGASEGTPMVAVEPGGNLDQSGQDDPGGAAEPAAQDDPVVAEPAAQDGPAVDEPDAPAEPEVPSYVPDVEPANCQIPAAANRPIGYGAATTGGGGATPVVVRSFEEAEAVLADYRSAFKDGDASSLVVRYEGTFNYASITDVCAQHDKEPRRLEIKEMDNVTFEGGRGSSANFGIHVNRAKNVIVRNMTMGLLPGGGDSDALTIEGNGTNGDVENVWIDHNELFSSTKSDCPGAGDTEFDGLIDIKKGARRITISYNYLHDHQKTGLLGFSDSDDTERYVTFHHNRYENVVSRTPLLRYGFVHLFNNYFGSISGSGINVRMGGVALIESNFFENAVNPVTSRYSDEAGFWELRNNHLGPGITWSLSDDTLANADDWQSTTTFPAGEINYAYQPDQAGCVKQIVRATAGATL